VRGVTQASNEELIACTFDLPIRFGTEQAQADADVAVVLVLEGHAERPAPTSARRVFLEQASYPDRADAERDLSHACNLNLTRAPHQSVDELADRSGWRQHSGSCGGASCMTRASCSRRVVHDAHHVAA